MTKTKKRDRRPFVQLCEIRGGVAKDIVLDSAHVVTDRDSRTYVRGNFILEID